MRGRVEGRAEERTRRRGLEVEEGMEEHYRAHLRGRGGGERRGEEHPGVGGTPRGEKRGAENACGDRVRNPPKHCPVPSRGGEGGREEGRVLLVYYSPFKLS